MLRRAAFLLCILGLAGCGGSKSPDEVSPDVLPALIEVKNLHALPVSIDITGNGTRYHLGTVHPGMRGSFKVPVNVTSSGSVELVVTPSTNARPFTSGPLLLGSAAVVDLIVTARLFNSTASIRP
ncbi:MAG: hypothetical protein SF070_00680 [Gemmatimonadota bacterium]|nr:hypothetical protein [Gemmatimonadota bacterium]